MKHMKKALLGALLLLLAVALCACGNQENAETSAQTGAGRMVNLTALSQSMRYAQAYNMLHIAPEEYIGSTVRVKGPHSAIFNEATRKNDHYITVSDSTVCCYVELPFQLASGQTYPERDAEVEIEGTFQSDQDAGVTYYYLANAVVR